MIEYTNQWPGGYPGKFPALERLKYVQAPKKDRFHARYDMFTAEMPVKIKDHFEVKGDCNEATLNAFKRYKGQYTTVQCMFNQCCTLHIDGGHWAWSFDWIDPIYNHLESELFEI